MRSKRCARRIATSASRRAVALAQPLELVEIAGSEREVALQAVGLLAAGERFAAAASARSRVGGIRAELALERERAREVRDRRVGVRGCQREPPGAQPERRGRRELAAALEVLGDHRGRLLAPGEEARREQPADPRVALALRRAPTATS